MKPGAILESARALLIEIQASSRPANEVINAYTRARRYIGSNDRKALADRVWFAVRHRRRMQFLGLGVGEACPEVVAGAPDAVNWEVPDWMPDLVDNPARALPALLEAPPVVLRANGNREKIRKLLADEGFETEPTALSPYGLILTKRGNLAQARCYRDGLVEIQDEGSQLAALETGVKPGDAVLDYCAGAGGKSLIFAQMMGNRGAIVAHDVSERSLAELEKRARRAGATCIRTMLRLEGLFDHVVVDAPCSGTGTWRRCPDARWKLTREQVDALVRKQADILDAAVAFVRPGGRLSYLTCSLLRPENDGQVCAFLARHAGFALEKRRQFSPATTQTDGLFSAVFQKTTG
ncbi:MAG: RsmB/NOP family class I SAM-dependent RNA methyltransferase [Alphaproteobacteria bacterium]|nr:RsmB/NOP family class I SAM-dependent RNA methyltransferase [Alphaproteobacteria bacterium]